MSQAAPPLAEGRYQLIDVLGVGGMATVYRGYDARLQVPRAVKVLLPALARKRSLRTRFETEASTMALLEHRHIVRVYDVGIDADRVYIVMELVTGGSLLDRVKQHGPLPPRMAVEAMIAMLEALDVAHSRGVVHRDIKPHNVLITSEGELRLTDFGIARIRQDEEDDGMTKTGAVMGTWGFMAPEQRVDAKSVDVRADIYSVGATLYAVLTDKTPVDLFVADMDSKLLADLPKPLAEVIQKACKYERDERYPAPKAMIGALKALLPELPEDPEGTPPLTAASPDLAPIDPTKLRVGVGRGAAGGGTGLLAQSEAAPGGAKKPAAATMVPDFDTDDRGPPPEPGLPEPEPVNDGPSGLTAHEEPEAEAASNKGLLVAGGVALLAVLGVGAWALGGGEDEPVPQQQPVEVQPEPLPEPSPQPEPAPEIANEPVEEPAGDPVAEPEVQSDAPVVVEVESEAPPVAEPSPEARPKATAAGHTPPRAASVGQELALKVQLGSADYNVTLSYKPTGGTYAHKPMHGSGGAYTATVPIDASYAGKSLEYYIKAQPRAGGEAWTFKSGFGPQKVPIQ